MYNFIVEAYNGYCLSCWIPPLDLEYSRFKVEIELYCCNMMAFTINGKEWRSTLTGRSCSLFPEVSETHFPNDHPCDPDHVMDLLALQYIQLKHHNSFHDNSVWCYRCLTSKVNSWQMEVGATQLHFPV